MFTLFIKTFLKDHTFIKSVLDQIICQLAPKHSRTGIDFRNSSVQVEEIYILIIPSEMYPVHESNLGLHLKMPKFYQLGYVECPRMPPVTHVTCWCDCLSCKFAVPLMKSHVVYSINVLKCLMKCFVLLFLTL